jgi:hypothetical protein
MESGFEAIAALSAYNIPLVRCVSSALNKANNLLHASLRISKRGHEVIGVDGRSVNSTIEVAHPRCLDAVSVTEPRGRRGVAPATGFNTASGDVIGIRRTHGRFESSFSADDELQFPIAAGEFIAVHENVTAVGGIE